MDRQLPLAESPRRFPTLWHADPMPGGYVVREANGRALACIYSSPRRVCGRRRAVAVDLSLFKQ
jgi:hypothetical protein